MRARVAGTAVGLVAAAVLAGCGSSSSGGTSAAGGAPAAPAGGATASSTAASSAQTSSGTAATTVPVKATEFAFALPTTHFAPGTYTFVMTDDGHATHGMEIEGPGVDGVKSNLTSPGGTATMTVTLQPGTYEFFCPVGNHRAAGMQATLTVG